MYTLLSSYVWTGRILTPRFFKQINNPVLAREYKNFKLSWEVIKARFQN